MKQCPLGQNEPQINVVGYGAMSFTDRYGPATDAGSKEILDACVDLGMLPCSIQCRYTPPDKRNRRQE